MTYLQLSGLTEMRRACAAYEAARSRYSCTMDAQDREAVTQLRAVYEEAVRAYERGLAS